MLCSDPNSFTPVVKMADMGLVGPKGYKKKQLQPTNTRAPEVWSGHPCDPVADIWSIGAAFVSWICKTVFGPADMKDGIPFPDAWCIAKIIRGFETAEDQMPAPPSDAEVMIQSYYELGRKLLEQEDDGTPESMHVPARLFFDEVLSELGLAPQVGDLLRKILVLDPRKRPTAGTLLESKEYRALLNAAEEWRVANMPGGDDLQSIVLPRSGDLRRPAKGNKEEKLKVSKFLDSPDAERGIYTAFQGKAERSRALSVCHTPHLNAQMLDVLLVLDITNTWHNNVDDTRVTEPRNHTHPEQG